MGRSAIGAFAVLVGMSGSALASPANDDCAAATVVESFPFTDTVDMTTATADEPDGCGGPPARSVWYRIRAPSPEVLLRARIAGSVIPFGEMTLGEYRGSCGALTQFRCDFASNEDDPEVGIAPRGQDVLLRVGFEGEGGTLQLAVDRLPEFLLAYPGKPWPAVAGGTDGFLAVAGNLGRSFDATGAALGAPIMIADGSLDNVDVAATGTGSFVVVWDSFPDQLKAARVDGSGGVTALPEVSAVANYPRVAADADGDFVVVWSDGNVMAQRFDASGGAQGAAFQVNTSTTGGTGDAAVAMAPGGEFVVSWTAEDGNGDGIRARLFDASGSPVDDDFVVNQATARDQYYATVGMDGAGNFVVAWISDVYQYLPPIRDPVLARRFDATGQPLGDDQVVSTENYYPQTGRLDVAVAPGGEFMVVWETFSADSDTYPHTHTAIAGRRFAADGSAEGPQFFVNTLVREYQYDPQVAASDAGSFMVVWEDFRNFFSDNYGDPSDSGVVARVLPAASPCSVAPLAGCRQPTVPRKAKLLLAHDVIRWTWPKGEATDVAAFGDPQTSDDYVLCLYDGTSGRVFDAPIPAGGTCGKKSCWKGLGKPPGSTGFKYGDKQRTPEGIRKLVLKAGSDGKASVVVTGGGPHLGAGALGLLPLSLPARLQLQGPDGACWEAVYAASGVTTNDTGKFAGTAE